MDTDIPAEVPACPHCAPQPKGSRFRLNRNLVIVSIIFLVLYLVSLLPGMAGLNASIRDYFAMLWWAVLLGLVIGGLIEYFVPEEFIYRHLGSESRFAPFTAVLTGTILSACSHGILAIAIQLYKKGASIPSVISLLLAAPWANLSITLLFFSFFGWKALLIIGAAIVIAIITGYVYMFLESRGLIEKSKQAEIDVEYEWVHLKNFSLMRSLKGVGKGTLDLANTMVWWILVGFIAAVLIRTYVPGHVLVNYFGPNLPGMLLTLLAATVIEVCSEGSAPIAFEIYNQLGVIGNSFVFLMAGVVTDYTEIGLVWTNIGKRAALWLPVVTVPLVMACGFLFNSLF